MDPTRTGEWIAARRKEKNLTQRELAARLGVTDKAVSRWETGKGYPDVSLLPALADELGCSVNELLSGRRLAPDEVPAAAEENLAALCRTAGQPLPNDRRLFDFQNVSILPDRIVIRNGLLQLAPLVLLFLMGGIGLIMSWLVLREDEGGLWLPMDRSFLAVWILFVLVLFSVIAGSRLRSLTVDQDGVNARSLFKTRRLPWTQIQDYGAAYYLHDRDHLLYTLYFSDAVLEHDEEGRKRFTRSTLRVDLPSQTLDRNIRAIMDFCGRHTQVLPFLVYPYDRLRFQSPDEKSDPAPLSQPLRDKPGRRLLALAFAVLALGLVFPVMDRFLNPDTPSAVLRLLGAAVALAGGLAVLWANIRRLRTDHRQVEQFGWSTFFEVMTVALLSVALGIFLLVLALH